MRKIEVVEGHSLAESHSERMEFYVRDGKWLDRCGAGECPCAVIEQIRIYGSGESRPFRLVLDVDEVECIAAGLRAWMEIHKFDYLDG